MKIHEYQAAELFARVGIPVNPGRLAVTEKEALAAAEALGYPVVLKAQVLTGGRGKAGGVKVAASAENLKKQFSVLKSLTIKGYPVEKVYVVKAVDFRREIYLAVTVDAARGDVVLICSPEGGVDIEETAKRSPDKIHKFYCEGKRRLDESRWEVFLRNIFDSAEDRRQLTSFAAKLVDLLFDQDASLVEINPLVVDEKGSWLALDAKVNLDDNALFRHPEGEALRDPHSEDPDEAEARQYGLSFVKLDGQVGCIVNGAGLAMATMDMISLMGGKPANFLDVGGSSHPDKVFHALDIILRNDQVRAILINIFGGITRCDDIAKGILAARERLNLSIPMVVRLTGTNEKEAKAMLGEAGITTHMFMRDAVQEVVALAAKGKTS